MKRFFLTFFLALALVIPGSQVFAQSDTVAETTPVVQQETAGVSTAWRVVQIIALIGAIVSMGLLIYGAVLWRNAVQNNDLLLADRGRNLTVLFGIAFFLFLILLIISFVVISQQRAASIQQQQQIQTSGAGGLSVLDSLLLVEAIPTTQVPIRNVAVQLLFNQPVSQTAVETNIQVASAQNPGTPIVGTWQVDGEYALFQPNQTCPTPNQALRCFDASQTYQVTIARDLSSEDGDLFRCSLAVTSDQCQFTFTTGEAIDATPPTANISLPLPDAAVPQDSAEQVEAVASDDLAIASLHFFVDGERIGVSAAPGNELQKQFRASTVWLTENLPISSTHTIQAVAYDYAARKGEARPVTVEILPLYCFDGKQNEDEEGLDCGGPTCRACQGAACTENGQCSSGLCFNGVCQEFPVIEEVIYPDGAVGNLVTIRGRNFGAEAGSIIFLGTEEDGDNVTGATPPCEAYWTSKEVIIEVPQGAVSGPLRIETSQGLFDTTDDSKGERVSFTVNDIIRPTLCAVQPPAQQIGRSVQILGRHLGTEEGKVLFGQTPSSRVQGWADEIIAEVFLPSIQAGPVSVTVEAAGETSNPVSFLVQSSDTLPFIDSVTPDRGPVGQMFSIHGRHFTASALVRFLDPRTGETTLADTRLPRECEQYRSTEQRAYRVPNLEPGTYQLYVETDAGQSNSIDFIVTRGDRLPGLCGMTPDNGPLGIEVLLHGEGFGSQPGGVRFSPRIDDAQIVSWKDNSVQVVVPPLTQSGPVQVIDADGVLSNSLNFTVGSCSPDTCSEGLVCCASGACQNAGTCAQNIPFCTYEWLFSTGDDLGGPPRVIEDASCKTNTQSPSPYKDTKDACLNAQISARFTHDMKDSSLSLDNVAVHRCNSGALLDSSQCQTEVNLTSLSIINGGQVGEGFIATSQVRLDSDTWYEVVLSTGFTAENGLSMVSPYRWVFKTQVGDGECEVDHVEVTPPTAILKQLLDRQSYTALPVALNCNILNPDEFSWGWLSSDTSKARVLFTNEPRNTATAVGPTDPGPPVQIIGQLPDHGISDSGLLTVRLLPPQVVNKWPNCSSACVNASIGARFDQDMNVNSVTSVANLQLFRCADTSCAKSGLTAVSVGSIKYNETDKSVFFGPAAGGLLANTSYRVVLKNLTSSSGLGLGNLNYDSDSTKGLDSYSWIFTVRDSADLCTVEDVSVIPPLATSSLIGEEFDYFSIPLSAPDACSADGQYLNPESYSWGWNSRQTSVGTISNNDVIAPSGFIDPYQVAQSAGPGETKIEAQTEDAQGEGDLIVACGFQSDLDCPAPATIDTYAVGNDSCCRERPVVVSFNPPSGSDSVCTTLAVEIQFSQPMEINSLLSNIILERFNGTEPCSGTQTTAWQRVKGFMNQLLAWVVPSVGAQAENWCAVPSNVTVNQYLEGSRAFVYPQAELAKNAQYRVRVVGDSAISDGINQGARSTFGVSMSGDAITTFTTGEAKCSLDVVDVIVTPPGKPGTKDIFFCATRNDCPGDVNPQVEGNQHSYIAVGRDLRGFAVPASYRWTTNAQSLLSLNLTDQQDVEATTQPTNGNAYVTVHATALAPSQGSISRTVSVKIFLCENPWPSILDFPYIDIDFNYDTFYCRDFGEPGVFDDLPPLSSPIVGDAVGDFLHETLFIVE